jgi:hypothetical protein
MIGVTCAIQINQVSDAAMYCGHRKTEEVTVPHEDFLAKI